MKIHRTVALLACFVFGMLQASAQESTSLLRSPDFNKPKRFADLPEKQLLYARELEKLLYLPVGAPVAVSVAKQFTVMGTVVSVSAPSDKTVKSVVVRITNRPGTAFTFTRILEKDGSFSYSGRMMGRETGDALEIVKEGEGYVLRKKGLHEMINE
jgi:hypothetical protein